MKLVIINTLSEDKIKSLKKAVPGAIVESYKSPKEAMPHVADADAIAMWGFQDAEPILAAGPKRQSAVATGFLVRCVNLAG